jgi:signal transduction histidine kinase
LWLLRLMADRGLALLDADTLLIVIEERGELRVAASSGEGTVRVRIMPVRGSALGALHLAGKPVSLDRPRGQEAAWLHELGLEARAALVEPLSMEGQGSGLVIALRSDDGFREPDRQALSAFAASVAQRLAAERSVEIERLRYGMEARERERTRWARELHDESIQGIGALRLTLANARDLDERKAMEDTVDAVLEGLDREIDGLRHLITELRPAALDDLGLDAALRALARRAQAIDGLEVQIEIDLDPKPDRSEHDRSRTGPLPTAAVDEGARRLDPELESTIYRIVQEALTNVSRHAQATKAVVSISEREGVVRASVTDDGQGLPDAGRLGPRGDGLEGGFGMSGMRERAELVGGELEFAPAPARGTVVRLTVPLAGRPAPTGRDTTAERGRQGGQG